MTYTRKQLCPGMEAHTFSVLPPSCKVEHGKADGSAAVCPSDPKALLGLTCLGLELREEQKQTWQLTRYLDKEDGDWPRRRYSHRLLEEVSQFPGARKERSNRAPC